MRLVYCALLLLDISLAAQPGPDTIADRILARADNVKLGAPYVANQSGACQFRPQQAFGANGEWSESCTSQADGLIEQSFFYAFDESGPLRLRLAIRPQPPANIDVAQALRVRLTRSFGAPTREASLMEVGLPFAGDHWSSGKLHYFLFQNPAGMHVGVRGPVELIVVAASLFREIQRDKFVGQADVLFYPESPARPFLQRLVGDYDVRLIDAKPKTSFEGEILAQQISREAVRLLDVAARSLLDERAMLLLAANGLVTKLSQTLPESPAAAKIRAQLAKYAVKLGALQHYGGLAYGQDLLWRVWREYPDTQAGQLAFLELQQHGWYTGDDLGCPANPDVFHEVIERGEAFLSQHPATPFRKEVVFTLAVANESWWSVARAPADDEWVNAPPYPRKQINKHGAEEARDRAIAYYQEIVKLAPDSPEAASAERRLPRLKLGLDTGQRRFFCSFD